MKYSNIYFIGIGGIGMSAIARYFLNQGKNVGGYDRTPTPLTLELEKEGAKIHYNDDLSLIGEEFREAAHTLVVYTPAVPHDMTELTWFRSRGFQVEKRSEMLGHLTEGKYVMAVAGTHGKTTTTTLLAWLNHVAAPLDNCKDHRGGCGPGSAFLGGISRNFMNNFVLGDGERIAVEADEFDRSFLRLYPDVAVVTSADADHLDIYGTHETMKEAFGQFIGQIKKGGAVIIRKGVDIELKNENIDVYSYSLDQKCDFYAANLELLEGGYYNFDIVCPDRIIKDCRLGLPGLINIENAVAAVSAMWVAGFDEIKLRGALATFQGVKRRFEFYLNTPDVVYMDDYAHHPRELSAAITSVKQMFPERKMTAIFQPHLYSRTRDFYKEFGEDLSMADEVILLPIYPARELPIEGITSEIIGKYITVPYEVIDKEQFVDEVLRRDNDIVVTFGAGDIDGYCLSLAEGLKNKYIIPGE